MINKNRILSKIKNGSVIRALASSVAAVVAIMSLNVGYVSAEEPADEVVIETEVAAEDEIVAEMEVAAEDEIVAEAEVAVEDEVTGYAIYAEETDLEVVSTSPVPTEAEAYYAMMNMKPSYPEGMPWTNDNFYAWKGGVYSGGYGCAGFAFILSDAAFGDLPARRIFDGITIDMVHVGDILRINNDTHSVIVLQNLGSKIVVAEGNYGGAIHWGRELSAANVAQSTYLMTRYPVGTFGNSCTVSYNLNGGSGTVASQIFEKGKGSILTSECPKRKGYSFLGWSKSSTATEAEYEPNTEYIFDTDVTLYAVWKEGEGASVYPCKLAGTDLRVYSDGLMGLRFVFNPPESLQSIGYSVTVDGEYYNDVNVTWTIEGLSFNVKLHAKEMSDAVTVSISDGFAIVGKATLSVREYVDAAMKLTTTTDEQKNFMCAMLNFGAATQTYFGYKDRDLANALLSETEKSVQIDSQDINYNWNLQGECAGIEYLGTSLVITSGFTMRHYFAVSDDINLDEYSIAYDGKDAGYKFSTNGIMYVDVSVGGIDKYFSTTSLVISKGSESMALDYGLTVYAARACLGSSGNVKLNDLAKSMVVYGKTYKILAK